MIILVVGTAFFVATTTFVWSDHPNPSEHPCDLPSPLNGSLAPKIIQLYRKCYVHTIISRMGADTVKRRYARFIRAAGIPLHFDDDALGLGLASTSDASFAKNKVSQDEFYS
jgi:hypothetical protein